MLVGFSHISNLYRHLTPSVKKLRIKNRLDVHTTNEYKKKINIDFMRVI